MRDRKLVGNLLWAVLFIFAATFGFNGCGNVNDVASTTPPPPQPGPLTILTSSPLPAATTTVSYDITLAPSGGTPPYTWSLAPGSPTLPNGLMLTASTGDITGTPTATGTTFTEFKLKDSTGNSVQKVLSIKVNASPTPLAILTNSLPPGTINQIYAFALGGTGGTTPYTWGLKAGSPPLPSGLTLDKDDGGIRGTPTVTSNDTHIFTLTDATLLTVEKSLQLSINAIPLSITTPSLPQGTANQNYSATLTASGGTGAYTWGVSPALSTIGLTLNTSTGLISGFPTSTSNQTYTFTVTDQTPPTPQTATKTLQLIIGAAPPTLAIDTNSLPPGTVFQSYNFTLAASGGTGAKTWDLVGGSLPAGFNPLSLSGVISGTPTSAGTTSATFRVRDSGNPTQLVQKQLSITINLPAAPTITTTSASLLPNGVFNQSYSRTLQVSAGTPPFIWSFTGGSPFPNWLNLNTSTGVISGTPNATGTFNFNVQVTDNTGQSDPNPPSLSITIVAQAPPTITPFNLPIGTVNVAYPNTQLTATGGIPPYTWSVTPAALAGGALTLHSSSGVIDGTPLSAGGPTSHTFRVTDSTKPDGVFSELTRSLTINAALTINTTSPLSPSGTVGDSYGPLQLSASGGTPPYTWSIAGTGAPSTAAPGLTLSSGGVIGGSGQTPTTADSFTRTYQVQDDNGVAVIKSLTLNVNAALTIDTDNTTLPLPAGIETQPYSGTLAASGGTQPYTWSVDPQTPLPLSLSLNSSTGEITGAPDSGTAGTTSHNFTVQDSASHLVSKLLNLTINP